MNNAIYPLFACPLMISGKHYEFSDAEREHIANLEMAENVGNLMSKSDKILDSAELAGLKSFIDEQILNYKKNLLQVPDGNEIYVTQSWVNNSHADQFHPKHRHPNSVISGVMFLDENKDGSIPPIRFHRAQEALSLDFKYDELNDFNASCREFDPEQGMLMLFPSQLEHDVGKNTSGRMRTSISFNTFARGTLGGRKQLTEVELS